MIMVALNLVILACLATTAVHQTPSRRLSKDDLKMIVLAIFIALLISAVCIAVSRSLANRILNPPRTHDIIKEITFVAEDGEEITVKENCYEHIEVDGELYDLTVSANRGTGITGTFVKCNPEECLLKGNKETTYDKSRKDSKRRIRN